MRDIRSMLSCKITKQYQHKILNKDMFILLKTLLKAKVSAGKPQIYTAKQTSRILYIIIIMYVNGLYNEVRLLKGKKMNI